MGTNIYKRKCWNEKLEPLDEIPDVCIHELREDLSKVLIDLVCVLGRFEMLIKLQDGE